MSSMVLAHFLVGAVPPAPDTLRDAVPAISTPGSQFGAADARILANLNLTGEQRRELDQVSSSAVARYRQLREQFNQEGDLWAYVRGQNATADWARSEFQRIMTKEQHARYVDEWYRSMAPNFENSKSISGSRTLRPISKRGR